MSAFGHPNQYMGFDKVKKLMIKLVQKNEIEFEQINNHTGFKFFINLLKNSLFRRNNKLV